MIFIHDSSNRQIKPTAKYTTVRYSLSPAFQQFAGIIIIVKSLFEIPSPLSCSQFLPICIATFLQKFLTCAGLSRLNSLFWLQVVGFGCYISSVRFFCCSSFNSLLSLLFLYILLKGVSMLSLITSCLSYICNSELRHSYVATSVESILFVDVQLLFINVKQNRFGAKAVKSYNCGQPAS